MHPLAHIPFATLGRRLTDSEYAEQREWALANPDLAPTLGTPVNGLYFVRFAKLRPGGVLLVTEDALDFHKAKARVRRRKVKERNARARQRYLERKPAKELSLSEQNKAFLEQRRAEIAALRVAICNNPPGDLAKPPLEIPRAV